jgi:hypothetical protein
LTLAATKPTATLTMLTRTPTTQRTFTATQETPTMPVSTPTPTTRESFTAMQGTPTTPTAANMASSKRPTASHDDHAAAEKPLWLKVLNLFGIGMGLPISMALPLLMMVWGAVGLIANRLLEPLLQLPALFAPLSMGVALLTMAFAGRTAGLIIRRVLRDEAPPIVDKYGLVGSTGRAVYEITP